MLLVLQLNNLLGEPPVLVEVPDVVGNDQATGTAALEAEGFVVAAQTAYSSTVAAGLIISQSPAGGVEAPEGSTVTITVSLGEAPHTESNAGGWAFYLRYEQERDRRRRKRLEELEAEEAIQELPPVEKEIAELLQRQEKHDERKAEIERLKKLVQEHSDAKELPPRVAKAFYGAQARQTVSSLLKLDKELKQMMEDEEYLVLMLLLND
jgi:predicted nucleic acid-binding protein